MKRTNKMIWISIIVFTAIIAIGTVYALNFAFGSKKSLNDYADAYKYLYKHEYLEKWITELEQNNELKDTVVHSDYNGIKLHALYIKAKKPTTKTAVIVHGYTDNAARMLHFAHMYNHLFGYNVIIPDLSGHGKSDGDWIQMGWLYRPEIKQWVNLAINTFGKDSQIVMHGLSMGAATIMMYSGDKLPDNVKCFVEDCGYTSVYDQFKYQIKKDYHLPAFPMLYTTSWYCDYKLGWDFKKASAIKQVRESLLPMFFIHGDSDVYVPTDMVYRLFEAKKGNKQLWVVPNTGHADAYWNETDEYVKRVGDFVSKYVKG